ncbi:MAG TPA: prepilin-type N-terminal cleavage/methylation domain-containing protein [Candidatus Saccharimonadales bacterium]|nr:prepilin-type N-terminal cleavage/methylation domain-containing protein [Candidatus Saccharimonadales bacterium]
MTAQNFNIKKGFTLIELLVVIGILAILLAITLIAINPARQFGQSNDTKRRADVGAILNAVGQYQAENSGVLPAGIPVSPTAAANVSSAGADLCALLTPKYLANLPADPTAGSPTTGQIAASCPAGYDTGYTIVASTVANGSRVTVSTTTTYSGTPISVTR